MRTNGKKNDRLSWTRLLQLINKHKSKEKIIIFKSDQLSSQVADFYLEIRNKNK